MPRPKLRLLWKRLWRHPLRHRHPSRSDPVAQRQYSVLTASITTIDAATNTALMAARTSNP